MTPSYKHNFYENESMDRILKKQIEKTEKEIVKFWYAWRYYKQNYILLKVFIKYLKKKMKKKDTSEKLLEPTEPW